MTSSKFTTFLVGALTGVFMAGAAGRVADRNRGQRDSNLGAIDWVIKVAGEKSINIEGSNPDNLSGGAIEGVLKRLDPHSYYFDPTRAKQVREQSAGGYAGIGTGLKLEEDGTLQITNVDEEGPAARAGIKKGDVITHVDGASVKELGQDDSIAKIRGAKDTRVELTIRREGVSDPLSIGIVRDFIPLRPVTSAVIGGDIGLIRLSQFIGNSESEMVKAIEKIQKQTNNSVRAYILDLRYNPGGDLDQAIGISDLFIDNIKEMVSLRDRDGWRTGRPYYASRGDILDGKPLIVLTNGASASASEIVSGVLQDDKRALVLGTPTYGKGSGQSVYSIPDREDMIALTTFLYYLTSGRSIQNTGVIPDIRYDGPADPLLKDLKREADQPGAVPNPLPDRAAQELGRTFAACSPAGTAPAADSLDPSLKDAQGNPDYQLICAVERLRNNAVMTKTVPVAPPPAHKP